MLKFSLTLIAFILPFTTFAQDRINLINVQVQGVPNAQQIKDGYKDKRWQGNMQQIPINMRGRPANQIIGLARALPMVRNIRLPFNINSFNSDGSFHPEMELWLSEAARQNFSILWVLMDGPSQEAEFSTLDGYRRLMPQLKSRQTAAFSKLIAWLKKHPEQSVLGFEAINEPATYDRAGKAAAVQNEFIGYYVEHVEAIHKIVSSAFPKSKFFIGGWRYSAWFDVFQNTRLPNKGNVTVLDYFRNMVGNQLVWSVHIYPQWFSGSKNQAEYEANILKRISPILKDQVVVTEINAIDEIANDPYYTSSTSRVHFINARSADFFAKHNLGIGWWTGLNYGASTLAFIAMNTEVEIHRQNSLGAGYLLFSAGNHPNFFTGKQWGRKELIVRESRKILIADSAPENGGEVEPVNRYAFGFGGLGTTVLAGRKDSINYLYGGGGRSIIYGSLNNDHLFGGNQGGVIRTGAGNNIVTAFDGDDLIYTGTGHNVVSAGKGKNTIVINPNGHTVIYGFSPERGDRLSLRRTFNNRSRMKKGVSYESSLDGSDLVIRTPQGGTVRLLGRGDIPKNKIVTYNLDLTHGWYARSWREPVDFVESDLEPR